MKKYFVLLIFFAYGFTYTARVKYCIDGDSFYLTNGKEIRLAEVDAPECTYGHIQAYGPEAKAFTTKYLAGKTVTLKSVAIDIYGRQVCEVYVDGIWFNEELVKAGYAWVYARYGSKKLYKEELRAKAQKRGLWAEKAIPPYIFRRMYK